jgi:dUTP pyrophosphatase
MNEREQPLTLKVVRLTPTAVLPFKAHDSDAGWDLAADEDSTLMGGHIVMIDTGLSIEIPPGYFGLIRDRSSLARQGGGVTGGVIDAGYRGPIKVVLCNHASWPLFIRRGDRIAQLLILPVPRIEVVEVESVAFLSPTSRGAGGFGSTGSGSQTGQTNQEEINA